MKYWTTDEIKFLRRAAGQLTIEEQALHLGRSASQVSCARIAYGIKGQTRRLSKGCARKGLEMRRIKSLDEAEAERRALGYRSYGEYMTGERQVDMADEQMGDD